MLPPSCVPIQMKIKSDHVHGIHFQADFLLHKCSCYSATALKSYCPTWRVSNAASKRSYLHSYLWLTLTANKEHSVSVSWKMFLVDNLVYAEVFFSVVSMVSGVTIRNANSNWRNNDQGETRDCTCMALIMAETDWINVCWVLTLNKHIGRKSTHNVVRTMNNKE